MSASNYIGRWGGYLPVSNPQDFADLTPPLYSEHGYMVYGLDIKEDKRFYLSSMSRGWYGDWFIEGNLLTLVATGAVDHDQDEEYLPEFDDRQTRWFIHIDGQGGMSLPVPKEDLFASELMIFHRIDR